MEENHRQPTRKGVHGEAAQPKAAVPTRTQTANLVTGEGLLKAAQDAYDALFALDEAMEKTPKHIQVIQKSELSKMRGRPR